MFGPMKALAHPEETIGYDDAFEREQRDCCENRQRPVAERLLPRVSQSLDEVYAAVLQRDEAGTALQMALQREISMNSMLPIQNNISFIPSDIRPE